MSGTVLLVEDLPAHSALAAKLLHAAGIVVLVAPTGGDGIALALGRRPDLVLLDIGLPDMDGWEVLRRLREHRPSLRVVAFTAHAMVGDRERLLAAGFDGYIPKPVDVATFADDVSRLLA